MKWRIANEIFEFFIVLLNVGLIVETSVPKNFVSTFIVNVSVEKNVFPCKHDWLTLVMRISLESHHNTYTNYKYLLDECSFINF